jgi:hypothetical protein
MRRSRASLLRGKRSEGRERTSVGSSKLIVDVRTSDARCANILEQTLASASLIL